jgi:hypothetical protein
MNLLYRIAGRIISMLSQPFTYPFLLLQLDFIEIPYWNINKILRYILWILIGLTVAIIQIPDITVSSLTIYGPIFGIVTSFVIAVTVINLENYFEMLGDIEKVFETIGVAGSVCVYVLIIRTITSLAIHK